MTATDANVTITTARTENVDTNYAQTTHLQSYLIYILTEYIAMCRKCVIPVVCVKL